MGNLHKFLYKQFVVLGLKKKSKLGYFMSKMPIVVFWVCAMHISKNNNNNYLHNFLNLKSHLFGFDENVSYHAVLIGTMLHGI